MSSDAKALLRDLARITIRVGEVVVAIGRKAQNRTTPILTKRKKTPIIYICPRDVDNVKSEARDYGCRKAGKPKELVREAIWPARPKGVFSPTHKHDFRQVWHAGKTWVGKLQGFGSFSK